MKKVLAILCILGILFFAIDCGRSIIFEDNRNPLHRLVSIEENEKSVSNIRIFRNILTGSLYLNVHSYYGEISYTKLVDESGNALSWKRGTDYEDRFDLVFALYSDDSGELYQTLVDNETHVVYRFYLTGDYSVHLETTENGTPLLWEGEVPTYEKILAS